MNQKNPVCDENAERVECGRKMSVLMPDSRICFAQPTTVDLAPALCGFMKLTNNCKT